MAHLQLTLWPYADSQQVSELNYRKRMLVVTTLQKQKAELSHNPVSMRTSTESD